jgi:hypothetical protein
MAFRDGPDDEALRDAWVRFCERLRAAGELVFKDANPPAPLHRADALRYLTQNLGQAFDLALETKDPGYPLIHPFCTPTRKLGGDAADFTYRQAWIDGAHAYRIRGTKGTARFLNITVQGPRPETQPGTGWPSLHEPFGDIPEANVFGHQLRCAADGSFELYVGGQPREVNWLPTTRGSRKLFIREGFDRWDETPTPLSIERLGMDRPRPVLETHTLLAAVDWAGEFLTGVMRDWPDHPYRYSGGAVDPARPNRFPPAASGDAGADARRGRVAANMVWRLEPHEALVVEFDAHDGFWMMSMSGPFMNSLDFLYRPVSYTPSRSRVDGDGKVRLVIAHDDPGVHNWLDPQGLVQGNLTYRDLLSQSPTDLRTRLVERSDLFSVLPADIARVTPQERSAQLRERFAGIRRRYGL